MIEADEYDTAFFDKRAKFVHYRPRTAILNNLEYDHADIYPDVASIRRQFNQLLRTVPGDPAGSSSNGDDAELGPTLSEGCWTPREDLRPDGARRCGLERAARGRDSAVGRVHRAARGPGRSPRCAGRSCGEHNVMNALAAIAAADHVGVAPERAALGTRASSAASSGAWRCAVWSVASRCTMTSRIIRRPSRRRSRACARGCRRARIIAVLEPRSNTMKLGVHREQLAPALAVADARLVLERARDSGLGLAGRGCGPGRARAFRATASMRWCRAWPGSACRAIMCWS